MVAMNKFSLFTFIAFTLVNTQILHSKVTLFLPQNNAISTHEITYTNQNDLREILRGFPCRSQTLQNNYLLVDLLSGYTLKKITVKVWNGETQHVAGDKVTIRDFRSSELKIYFQDAAGTEISNYSATDSPCSGTFKLPATFPTEIITRSN